MSEWPTEKRNPQKTPLEESLFSNNSIKHQSQLMGYYKKTIVELEKCLIEIYGENRYNKSQHLSDIEIISLGISNQMSALDPIKAINRIKIYLDGFFGDLKDQPIYDEMTSIIIKFFMDLHPIYHLNNQEPDPKKNSPDKLLD
jgi:hypothetical protein